MGLLSWIRDFRIARNRKRDETTKKRLMDAGVSAMPYTPQEKPGLNAETKAEVREKDATADRLRTKVMQKHAAVRAQISRM